MALIKYSVTLVAKQDAPYNVLPDTDVSIRKVSDGNLVQIYSDAAGLTPIAQPGAKTDSRGVFEFYTDSVPVVKAEWSDGVNSYSEIFNGNSLQALSGLTDPSDLDQAYARKFATLSDLTSQAFPDSFADTSVSVLERTQGNGGGAKWRAELTVNVTPNTFNVVQSTANPNLSYVLQDHKSKKINPRKWGAQPSPANSITGFNNGPVFQAIADYIADNGTGVLELGSEWWYTEQPLTQKVVNDRLGTNPLIIRGNGPTNTVIFSDKGIDFIGNHQDNFILEDLSLMNSGLDGLTKYTGTGVKSTGQSRFCRIKNVKFWWLKYGTNQRFTLWNIYDTVNTNDCLCGMKFARHKDMEDQNNPSATNFWNLSSISGTNTKTFVAGTIQDTTKSWAVDMLIGHRVTNNTQGVSGTITANAVNTFTVNWDSGSPLWNPGDAYTIADAGWFHNENVFTNILINGGKESDGGRGEVGILGSLQGCVFNGVTVQNFERSGSIPNETIPIGEKCNPIIIQGGGEYSTNAKGNLFNGLYIERSFKAIKAVDQDELLINGFFTQGQAGGDILLEAINSDIVVNGQTNQSAGWSADIVATDSNVTFDRPIQSSGGSSGRVLTNSFLSESGIKIKETPPQSYIPTIETEFGAVITALASADELYYVRESNTVRVQGRIDIDTLASNSGSYFSVSVPLSARNGTKRQGDAVGVAFLISGGVTEIAPCTILEGTSQIRIETSPVTLAGKTLRINIEYATTAFS